MPQPNVIQMKNPACIIREKSKTVRMEQWSFRGGTRGNAVPIVEKLPERMGTAFPLLNCLGTHRNATLL